MIKKQISKKLIYILGAIVILLIIIMLIFSNPMLFKILRIVIGLILTLFLPGFILIKTWYADKEDVLKTFVLSILSSTIIMVLSLTIMDKLLRFKISELNIWILILIVNVVVLTIYFCKPILLMKEK